MKTDQANWRRRDERGQMVFMAAITMVVVLGFAALTIDLGFSTHTKRAAQNDADAMVLAGARDLPDEIIAEDSAKIWGTKNGVVIDEIQDITFGTTCSGEEVEGTITARLKRNQKTFIASILGIEDNDLNVCATARAGTAAAGNGLLPLGFLDQNPDVAGVCYMRETDDTQRADLWGTQCDVKIANPSGTWSPGSAGGLALDPTQLIPGNYNQFCTGNNNGASEFEDNIINGSECPYAVDDQVKPKTGAVTGPTNQGFNERLLGNYDTIEQVFGTPNSEGVYTNVDVSSPRFGVIPVIHIPPGASGTSDYFTIVEFVTVYIVGNSLSGSGSNALTTISVIPMNSQIYASGIEFADGAYGDDVNNPFTTIKLVE
jgi:Putative Flp pilus-assembly TadE/G-like